MSCELPYTRVCANPNVVPVASYAEVLIDVRAHTETIVNVEPLQGYVPLSLIATPDPVS